MMKRILATLILAALPLVAADTVRDKAAVLALFADGQPAGSLSPQDMRDFIVTALNTTTNAQTGTTYTVLKSDRGKSVTHSNGAAIAVTLPQATGADFGNGFWYLTKNLGVGAVTITPATSTVGGGATLVLATGQWALLVSDGTNYNVYGVRITGGTSITITDAVTGQTVAVTGDGIGTAQLDDDSDTPGSGEYVQVDTDDQAGFTYRTDAEVLTDIGAQPIPVGTVSTTGATSAVGATNIVASASAGLYRVVGYMQTTTQATGACLSDVTLGWTYNSDVKSLEVVSNHDQEVDETYSQIPPTIVRSDGAANITYIISLDAGGDCSNAVFDYYLVAERLQ